jgi:hypothetical protein
MYTLQQYLDILNTDSCVDLHVPRYDRRVHDTPGTIVQLCIYT